MNKISTTLLIAIFASYCQASPMRRLPPVSKADQKVLNTAYLVRCVDCDDEISVKYVLKPVRVWTNGSRMEKDGTTVRQRSMQFRCPKGHEFILPAPEQIVPKVEAEPVR